MIPWSFCARTSAQAVIYLLAAHGGLTVNAQSAGILDVLVFGASTDYALLIVARYREELRRHDRRHPAMAEALRRAGPAIIALLMTVTACAAGTTGSASTGARPPPGKPTPGHRVTVRVSPRRRAEVTYGAAEGFRA